MVVGISILTKQSWRQSNLCWVSKVYRKGWVMTSNFGIAIDKIATALAWNYKATSTPHRHVNWYRP
jgi:hypothetical protein